MPITDSSASSSMPTSKEIEVADTTSSTIMTTDAMNVVDDAVSSIAGLPMVVIIIAITALILMLLICIAMIYWIYICKNSVKKKIKTTMDSTRRIDIVLSETEQDGNAHNIQQEGDGNVIYDEVELNGITDRSNAANHDMDGDANHNESDNNDLEDMYSPVVETNDVTTKGTGGNDMFEDSSSDAIDGNQDYQTQKAEVHEGDV